MDNGEDFAKMFMCPDEANQAADNLWWGSQPTEIWDYKYVFALNGMPKYFVENGQEVVIRPFNDGAVPDEEMLHDLAQRVLKATRKGKTLVHCQAGINRSSLIVALALVHDGMAPKDAIAHLKKQRGTMVLSNPHFVEWLLELPLKEE
jgi:protein-tyrosine phosphatase